MFHIRELRSDCTCICSMPLKCWAIRFYAMYALVVLRKIKKRCAYRTQRLAEIIVRRSVRNQAEALAASAARIGARCSGYTYSPRHVIETAEIETKAGKRPGRDLAEGASGRTMPGCEHHDAGTSSSRHPRRRTDAAKLAQVTVAAYDERNDVCSRADRNADRAASVLRASTSADRS